MVAPQSKSVLRRGALKRHRGAGNRFVQWLFFGGEGLIAENDRDRQRKLIKYNHLVANCLIFHNVQAQTRVLRQLAEEGHEFDEATLSRLEPIPHGARQPVRQVHAEPGPRRTRRRTTRSARVPCRQFRSLFSRPPHCEEFVKTMAHFVANRCHTAIPAAACCAIQTSHI